MTEPNGILTFVDESGEEWLAAVIVGPLIRGDREPLTVDRLKDRAFSVARFTVVMRDGDVGDSNAVLPPT